MNAAEALFLLRRAAGQPGQPNVRNIHGRELAAGEVPAWLIDADRRGRLLTSADLEHVHDAYRVVHPPTPA